MVSGAPDFWLRGTYIDLVNVINRIHRIDVIDNIELIDEIAKVTQVDKINVITALKTLDKITEISKVKCISSFGETGTLTYFSKVATADVLTPTAGYRLKVLGAVVYNPTDVEAYLRWKGTDNLILGVPTIGLVGMNPMSLKHPLGATDEILELYMSAAGAVKGWVVTEEQYGIGTPHAKTVTELLGLTDSITKYHYPAGGEWVSPLHYYDAYFDWTNPAYAYDEDTSTKASVSNPPGAVSGILRLMDAPLTCNKIRFWASREDADIDKIIVRVWKDDRFVTVYEADWAQDEWVEVEFAEGTVGSAEIQFHNSGGSFKAAYLHEFDFWKSA